MIDKQTGDSASAFVDAVRRRYDCVKIVLYGSRARQTHLDESDVDIAVVLRGSKDKRRMDVLFEIGYIAWEVMSRLNFDLEINPVPMWETEWENPDLHSSPRFVRNIQKDGVLLWYAGQNDIVR